MAEYEMKKQDQLLLVFYFPHYELVSQVLNKLFLSHQVLLSFQIS